MESQPQNPEFRNNPEKVQPCAQVCVRHIYGPHNMNYNGNITKYEHAQREKTNRTAQQKKQQNSVLIIYD